VVSVLSILVRHLGYDIECVAYDGSEIVQAVKEGKRPDAIIMDFRMPLMNGLQAARIVREESPRTRIILVSADDSVRKDARSEGFLFLPKPFSSASLAGLLKNTLGS
jgi:CheY-like chemotaxis protein